MKESRCVCASAVAVVFVTTAAFTSLASPAMALPMPWDTSKTPTATTHNTTIESAGAISTVTVLCTGNCYQ